MKKNKHPCYMEHPEFSRRSLDIPFEKWIDINNQERIKNFNNYIKEINYGKR